MVDKNRSFALQIPGLEKSTVVTEEKKKENYPSVLLSLSAVYNLFVLLSFTK